MRYVHETQHFFSAQWIIFVDNLRKLPGNSKTQRCVLLVPWVVKTHREQMGCLVARKQLTLRKTQKCEKISLDQ